MFWEATEWVDTEENDDYNRGLKKEFSSHKIFVQDGSDWRAELLTRDCFSCNEHHSKEPPHDCRQENCNANV